jgi:16S rRNA (uracil1498-N3)-methyltransferase
MLLVLKRFYSDNIREGRAILEGTERHHCVKVLRTVLGEEVEIVDGKGGLATGRLISGDKRSAIIELTGQVVIQPEIPMPTIAMAIPRHPSRWEYFLEKSTEIGVGEIIPLVCARSDKSRIREERSRQIVLSAFKQSRRHYLPRLADPVEFSKILESAYPERYIAHCGDTAADFLGDCHKKGKKAIVLIGPEGDFTAEEISLAEEAGFGSVSLGDTRLRVETAGLAACTILRCIDQLA